MERLEHALTVPPPADIPPGNGQHRTTPRPSVPWRRHPVLVPGRHPGRHPGRTGGPWLCRTFVLSLFRAVVVPSGFRTRVQPCWWITTWWWKKHSKHAVPGGRLAAVLLVLDVVHVARRRGLVAAAGPPALAVPQGHRVTDPGRDRLGIPDIQRQARPAQPHAELPAAQEARQPARARQQVHRLADDRLLQRRPGRRGVRSRRGARSLSGRVPASAAVPVQFHAQPDQVLQRGHVHVPGDQRGHRRVARDRLGGVAVEPGAALAAGLGRERPPRRPPVPDLRGPLLLQRGVAVEQQQVGQRDMHPRLDRLPGPLRQQPAGDQPPHRLGQRVVVPLVLRPVVVFPGRGAQRVQHPPDHLRALRRQVPVQHPGAAERDRQLQGAVREVPVRVRVLIRQVAAGPLVHLRDQRRQLLQPQPARRGRQQQLVGLVPELLRQPAVHKQISRPDRLRDLPGGQRRDHLRVGAGPPGPGGVPDGGAPGDPGPVDQPRHRAVLRVAGVPLPGGERGQHRGPRRRRDRGGLLELAQALGLGGGGEPGGVGGGEVAQPGADHVQRLTGTMPGQYPPGSPPSTGLVAAAGGCSPSRVRL